MYRPGSRAVSSHTRRITYSLRSNASWSSAWAGPAPTSSWRITGRHAPATSPVCSGHTGTSRHPSTIWPSAVTVRSTRLCSRSRAPASVGRKHISAP